MSTETKLPTLELITNEDWDEQQKLNSYESVQLQIHDADYHTLEIEQLAADEEYDAETNYSVWHPQLCLSKSCCGVEIMISEEGLDCLEYIKLYPAAKSTRDIPSGKYKVEYGSMLYSSPNGEETECWVALIERLPDE